MTFPARLKFSSLISPVSLQHPFTGSDELCRIFLSFQVRAKLVNLLLQIAVGSLLELDPRLFDLPVHLCNEPSPFSILVSTIENSSGIMIFVIPRSCESPSYLLLHC